MSVYIKYYAVGYKLNGQAYIDWDKLNAKANI